MSPGLYEGSFESISKDCLKEAGRFLFIRSTRLRMPVAAFWLKKYFCGTSWVSMHGNNIDSLPRLGDSEMLAVKHSPRQTIPELVHRLENDSEVSSSVASEKAVNVFEDNNFWATRANQGCEVMEES